MGGQGGQLPTQVLEDQLTLYQPGEDTLLPASPSPPDFWTFRHPCEEENPKVFPKKWCHPTYLQEHAFKQLVWRVCFLEALTNVL